MADTAAGFGEMNHSSMVSPFMSSDTNIVFEPADELRLAAAAVDLDSSLVPAADGRATMSRTMVADAAAAEVFPADLSVPVVISDCLIHAGADDESY